MKNWPLAQLKEKLALFKKQAEIDTIISESLTQTHLPQQDNYTTEEMNLLLDQLITYKGYVEFTARNMKINIIYNALNERSD